MHTHIHHCRDYVDLIDLTGISTPELSDSGSDSDELPQVCVTLSSTNNWYCNSPGKLI